MKIKVQIPTSIAFTALNNGRGKRLRHFIDREHSRTPATTVIAIAYDAKAKKFWLTPLTLPKEDFSKVISDVKSFSAEDIWYH